MAGPILKGETFAADASVTNEKLHDLVEDATFKGTDGNGVTFNVSGSDLGTCVAAGGLEVASGTGQLQVKDDGITAAKIAAGALTDVVYPIGSIFTTVNNYADSAAVVNAIGGTTWTAFGAGKVLVGVDSSDTDFDTVEETGGSKTHTLTISEMPAHTHTTTLRGNGENETQNFPAAADDLDPSRSMTSGSTGGGGAHNNVQPYITVYMWKRTA